MQLTTKEVFVAFLVSLALSATLTPIFRRVAISLGIVDRPNQQHKTHTDPIPYLGGISIVITLLIVLSTTLVSKFKNQQDVMEMLILAAAPFLLAVVGFIDDLRNLGVLSKLFLQTTSAFSVALLFVEFGWFGEPTDNQVLNFFVTTFWIVGITNAINFIDNLDGGAGGIVVISSITLTIAALIGDQFALAAIAVLIAGATLGFLFWNLHPARIYLGDAGALFLGSILAVLTIRLDPVTAKPFSGWFFAFLLFAVPILDTAVAVISRLLRGLSPFQGGRDHLSHRLLTLGLSKRQVAVLIWLLQVFFSVLGLMLFFVDSDMTLIIEIVAGTTWLVLSYFFLRLLPQRTKY